MDLRSAARNHEERQQSAPQVEQRQGRVTRSSRVITNADHHIVYFAQKNVLVFDVTCDRMGPGVIHLPLVPLTGRSDHFLNGLTAWSAQRKGVGIDTDQARIGPVGADKLV